MLPFFPVRANQAKPIGDVVLNPASPLAKKLAHAWVFSQGTGGSPNLVRPWERTSGGVWTTIDHGFALRTIVTDTINLNYSGRVPDPPFSIVIGFNNVTITALTTTSVRVLFTNTPLANTSSTSTIFTIEYLGGIETWRPGGTGQTLSGGLDTAAALVNEKNHHFHLDIIEGFGLGKFHRNDLDLNLGNTLSALQAGEAPFYLGGWGNGTRAFDTNFDYLYIFNSQLTEGERLYLKKYPYSIVTPVPASFPYGIPLIGRTSGATFSDTITEIVTLGDAVTCSVTLTATITELATLAVDLSVSVSITATLTESVVLADDLSGGLVFTSTVTETVVLDAAETVSVTLSTPITETATLADEATATASLTTALTELVALAEAPTLSATFSVDMTAETVTLDVTLSETVTSGAAIYSDSFTAAVTLGFEVVAEEDVIGRKQFTRRRGKMGFYALFGKSSQLPDPSISRELTIDAPFGMAHMIQPKRLVKAHARRVGIDLSKLDRALQRLADDDDEDVLLLMD